MGPQLIPIDGCRWGDTNYIWNNSFSTGVLGVPVRDNSSTLPIKDVSVKCELLIYMALALILYIIECLSKHLLGSDYFCNLASVAISTTEKKNYSQNGEAQFSSRPTCE
jgi:hypothetical protein